MKSNPKTNTLHINLPVAFLKSWRAYSRRNNRTMAAQARVAMQKELDADKARAGA